MEKIDREMRNTWLSFAKKEKRKMKYPRVVNYNSE